MKSVTVLAFLTLMFICHAGTAQPPFHNPPTDTEPADPGAFVEQEVGLKIFPNPSNGNISIHCKDAKIAKVSMSIADLTEKVVARQLIGPSQTTTLDLSSLSSGLYVV